VVFFEENAPESRVFSSGIGKLSTTCQLKRSSHYVQKIERRRNAALTKTHVFYDAVSSICISKEKIKQIFISED